MDILLVGAYPPPVGGNTIYVQRLFSYLNQAGHRARVLDYLGESGGQKPQGVIILSSGLIQKLVTLLRISRQTTPNTIVHFHVAALKRFRWVAPPLLFLFRRQPKIITIHSGSFISQTNHRLGRAYIKWLLQRFCKIITVNAEQTAYLKSIGISQQKLTVIPAFLPQQPDAAWVPQQVAEWQSKRTLVLTSGHLTPLYNYDVLIDCISKLSRDQYGFVFAFYNNSEPLYEEHIYDRLSRFNNLIILRDQPSDIFLSIVNACDIYVRTTTADGDSVAVRETLYFGKTVFASDCVRRPEGCHIFATHDPGALLKLFQNLQTTPGSSVKVRCDSGVDRILKVYEEVQTVG